MNIVHSKISDAVTIEEILCLSTLITAGELSSEANLKDATDYFENTAKADCSMCKLSDICLAVIINQ